MRLPGVRSVLKTIGLLLIVAYIGIAVLVATNSGSAPPRSAPAAPVTSVAIFGASGTAGDGILKAALASPDIETIHVITRRITPRMQRGIDSGKVVASTHMDYLDYTPVIERLADVDAVFWAIGLSSIGVEEDRYREIHVDFPMHFARAWRTVSDKPAASFHYISSSDISRDSRAMWARVKVEAEDALFAFADGSNLRVIAYRPDYIGPTREQAHLGQNLLFWFFRPLGAAVRAEQIGNAMIEVALRRDQFSNGDKIGTWKIWQLSDAYVD